MGTYENFLEQKFKFINNKGFVVDNNEVCSILKPHQKDIVVWSLEKGRAAIFAAFGLGKTIMQLEIMRIIQKREGGRCLIICPPTKEFVMGILVQSFLMLYPWMKLLF